MKKQTRLDQAAEVSQSASNKLLAGLWRTDFDMDILNLFPELLQDETILKAIQTPIWVYGSKSQDGSDLLSHPSVWNDSGALYFSKYPDYEANKDKNGWVSIAGHVTNDPLIKTNVFNAVRLQWHQGYKTYIDLYPWNEPIDYNEIFTPIMYHIRNVKVIPIKELERYKLWAKSWITFTCNYGINLIGRFKLAAS